jgi:uncharacterized protein (TIGR02996 family)
MGDTAKRKEIMTDGDNLLRNILDNPEDDTVRLVYADWLQENGRPEYAEFIRVQIELVRGRDWKTQNGCGFHWCPRCLYSPDPRSMWQKTYGPDNTANTCRECFATRTRNNELWNAHSGEWFGSKSPAPLPGSLGWAVNEGEDGTHIRALFHNTKGRYVIRRGFVDEAQCSLLAMFGGYCRSCGGVGDDAGRAEQYTECSRCKGTGDLLGVAKELFARQPVSKVWLTDRAPYNGETPVVWLWLKYRDDMWEPQDYDYVQHLLPVDLWDALQDYDTTPDARVFAKRYASIEAARKALSQACVRLGRKLADS